MPSSVQGRWSARFLTLSGGFLALFISLVASGQRGGETFFSNGLLAYTMIGAAASAICAGCAGVAAVRRRDHSLIVLGSIAIAAGVALWIAAEILFPH